jgi:hypothetical protein
LRGSKRGLNTEKKYFCNYTCTIVTMVLVIDSAPLAYPRTVIGVQAVHMSFARTMACLLVCTTRGLSPSELTGYRYIAAGFDRLSLLSLTESVSLFSLLHYWGTSLTPILWTSTFRY